MASFDLSNRVAVITGASRGIGRAIAEAFAEAGASVVLSSRKQEGVDAVAAAIRQWGGSALAVAAHTGDRDAVERLMEQAAASFGGIDIVVNNAATNPHFGPILTAEESQWAKILDVNVIGYFRVTKAAFPHLQARGGGKIINVASIAGLTPLEGMGVYSASKAAVIMLTRALALELAPAHVQVNAIAPGLVKTRFSQALWDNPALSEKVLGGIPAKRMASPEEIAAAALYLASPAADFVTGEVLVIDGGQRWRAGSVSL